MSPNEMLDKIREMTLCGMTRKEIALETGINYHYLTIICKFHGINPERRENVFWTDRKIYMVDLMKNSGVDYWTIAQIIGSTKQTVQHVHTRSGFYSKFKKEI